MGIKTFNNYEDLLTFTRASKGHALRPVSYGAEIFGNSGFDDTSEWTLALDSISISNGKLIYDATNNIRGADQQVSVEAGKIYQLSFEVLSGTARLYLSEGYASTSLISDLAAANYGVGKYVVNVVANGNYDEIGFSLSKFSGGTACEIDYFSLKEVTFDESDGTLTLFEHPDNIPRVEWDAQRNRLGLLVEEARTNLFHYSNDFSNSYWVKSELTATAEQGIAPDGTNTAFKLIESSTANIARHVTRGGGTLANSTQYTAAVYLKKGTRTKAKINVFTGTASHTGKYDIENGTVYSSAGADAATIEDVGNGWFRCSITTTTSASGTPNVAFGPLPDSYDVIYDGDGSSYIYAWGAQLEQASFPTSYIKSNSGSTTTRSADVASIPVADFGFNPKSMSMLVEWQTIIPAPVSWDSYNRIVSFSESGGSELIEILGTQNSANVYGSVYAAGAQQISYINFSTDGTVEKTAFRVGSNTWRIANDGTLLTEDTSVTMPTKIDRLGIGIVGTTLSSNELNGHIKSIQYYPRRLTNAQLQALTEPRSTPTLSLTFDGLESSYTENYIHG